LIEKGFVKREGEPKKSQLKACAVNVPQALKMSRNCPETKKTPLLNVTNTRHLV